MSLNLEMSRPGMSTQFITLEVVSQSDRYRTKLILGRYLVVYLSYKDPCPTISIHKSEIKVH